MRLSVRVVPWLVALAGLGIPLVGTNFALWQLVGLWLLVLTAVWLVGRVLGPRDRALRVLFGIAFLPMLFLLAWEGGWWLIPADIAWLIVEWRDRPPVATLIA
ncbi:MAG: hypothetical protein HYX55_07290 [Chloroflexi bacterium]|nr:hypothetical protein [Chloroflexota bacterium]